MPRSLKVIALGAVLVLAGCGRLGPAARPPGPIGRVRVLPGAGRPAYIYSRTTAHDLRPDLARIPPRVYVPNSLSNTVSVIEPAAFAVIATFPVGKSPQHVVPSHDLNVLWVNNNGAGSLTPIDPYAGRPGRPIPVDDPYNLYFTPDGHFAVVVAEALRRLDFRDPHTMRLIDSLRVSCRGPNHLDFSADGRYFLVSCEFSGELVKVDTLARRVLGILPVGGMPQDVRLSPDGRFFFVADMVADGVHVVDGEGLREAAFVHTGIGAHGITVSRDGRLFYVSNRGWHTVAGGPHGPGSVSVLDPLALRVVATWPVPGGGSPDMGAVSIDGRTLWLSGRYDHEVYAFDTRDGHLLARIRVGAGPHGLTYWPQPGRYSLGHTGNMR